MTQALKKENPGAVFKNAVTLYEQGDIAGACEGYRAVLKANPNDSSAWLNLGMALRKLGHFESSLACTKRAIEIAPENPSYLMNLGNCLTDLDRKDEALAAHAAAVKARPADFLVRRNYAVALREFGEFEQALAHFTAAQTMKPQDLGTKWEIALTYLYLERFKEGWDAFEIRWKIPPMKERAYNVPRWRGEDLNGKTVLVYEEQGFGDTILCTRYLPLIKARGGRVVLECKKPLHRLFSTIPGVEQIAEPGKADLPFDYHIPMMSLPGVFGTDLTNIPPPANFHVPVSLPPDTAQAFASGKNRFKVGIVWSGSVTFANNRRRAVGVERFLPLAAIPGVQLYSLQKGPCEGELAAAGATGLIPELAPHLGDFADTARVLKQLDLVIMTDSAVAHLAGSLGVPVWNLLNTRPYWLYLSDRTDSPWYPSMRLFRQPVPGDWDSVFKNVAENLEKAVDAKQRHA